MAQDETFNILRQFPKGLSVRDIRSQYKDGETIPIERDLRRLKKWNLVEKEVVSSNVIWKVTSGICLGPWMEPCNKPTQGTYFCSYYHWGCYANIDDLEHSDDGDCKLGGEILEGMDDCKPCTKCVVK